MPENCKVWQMAVESDLTYTFGNQDSFDAERLRVELVDGEFETVSDWENLGRIIIERGDYLKALEDINNSWRVITDPHTGKQFEIAESNPHASDDYDAEISTYTSSISGNAGNAVEFAENSALHPDRRRLYIASFGNGKTSYWSSYERWYIKKTGRFMFDDGTALPTVEALHRALQKNGYEITRLSTNSAGGALATALMAEMPEGQVTHAYLKSRTNLANHRHSLLWGIGILLNDGKDADAYRQHSEDPWAMTDEMVDEAVERMPEIFSPDGRAKKIKAGNRSHGPAKMWTDLRAYSRGGDEFGHPAAADTVWALIRQPRALMTFHFPDQDRLYNWVMRDVATFMTTVSYVAPNDYERMQSLITPGKHRDHTFYPAVRWAAETYAFHRSE